MVEFQHNRIYVVFSVPGYKDIRLPLKRWLQLAKEGQNVKHLQELILANAGITSWKTPESGTKKAAAVTNSCNGYSKLGPWQ